MAQLLPVALQRAGRACAGGGDGGIWVLPERMDRNDGRTAVLGDVAGDVAGDRFDDTSIRLSGELGFPVENLPGSLVMTNAQGTYEASPQRVRRLSRGRCWMSGPTRC